MYGNIKQEVFKYIELFVKDTGRAVSVAISIEVGSHTNENRTVNQRPGKAFLAKKGKKRQVYEYFKVSCKLPWGRGRGKLRRD